VGRVWTSTDGYEWELSNDIALAPYAIASNAAGSLVIAGEDDAFDLTGGQAAAASIVDDWSVRVFASADSQLSGATPYGDGFLIVGFLRSPDDGTIIGSALHVSTDGIEWEAFEPGRLEGIALFDVAAAGELVALVGRDFSRRRSRPVARWTRDLETLQPVRRPGNVTNDEFDVELDGVRLTDDGSRLFAFGVQAGRPAIWTATVE
jgi:hypothetical protein